MSLPAKYKLIADEYLSNGLNKKNALSRYGLGRTCIYVFKRDDVKKYVEERLKTVKSHYDKEIDRVLRPDKADKVWKRERLITIAEAGDDKDAIRAISELNKMDGDYAPVKTVNANFDIKVDNALFEKYKRDY